MLLGTSFSEILSTCRPNIQVGGIFIIENNRLLQSSGHVKVSMTWSPRWPGLSSVQGFVVDKVALVGQVSLGVLQFSSVRVTSLIIH